ncbi:glycerophosphodiester phosphodiesterase [Niallia sp. 03133]|uniref:glycerophosphodiester phosphodiesterase n=1 Tax=Niallia sp. 03133 TaxID=3458060 RepID=UPI004044AB3C
MRKPLITAHTGCMKTPPNSIQSVIEGIKSGADVIEVDVRSTKDGSVVLLHDEHFHTQHGMIRVQDVTFQELNDLTQSDKVVRLEEVLPLIKESNRVINLDVKEDHAIDPMIKTVEKFKMRESSIISGCEKDRAAFLKGNYRPYQVLLNASKSLFEANKEDYESFIKETFQDAIAASCCGINIDYRICREELIAASALRCLPVLVWTINETHEMEKYVKLGVHSITSHEVETLVELTNKQKT